MSNKQFILAKRPTGVPAADTWTLTEAPMPEASPGEVLIQTQYISLDPAMRGWMNDAKSYIRPVGIGEVMRAGTVGKVLESRADAFKAGDFVMGNGGVQAFHVAKASHLTPIDPNLAPLPTYLGTLGMPGMTAYFGLLEIGEPKAGETVVVSGAAGAVGSVVGQIAKIKGCRVVGIAGGPEKCAYLTEELGFDEAVDYKAGQVKADLKAACPKGVDVYFDNVGGEILDIVLARLARGARIVICGAISQYNNTGPVQGPKNYLSLLVSRARMQGMVVFDYADRYHLAAREMAGWMMQGQLKHRDTVFEGLENFPDVFLRLFTGEKKGKLVLKV